MLIPQAPSYYSQGQSHGLPAQIPASGNAVSNTINTNGLTHGSVGLKSTQAGNLSVQRYADAAGVVPLSTAVSVAILANTPVSVGWSDGLPCGSIIVTVTNSSGTTAANLTNVTVDLSP
jgi:hypothetical protein